MQVYQIVLFHVFFCVTIPSRDSKNYEGCLALLGHRVQMLNHQTQLFDHPERVFAFGNGPLGHDGILRWPFPQAWGVAQV